MSTGVQRSRAVIRHRKKSHLRISLRDRSPVLARGLAELFLFFFLSLSECFRLPSPFAACALAAYLLHRERLTVPLCGILASLGLRLIWHTDLDLWQYIGLGLLLLTRFRPPKAVWMASAYVASALSLRLFAQILQPATQEAMILCTVSLLVGTLCTPAICRAVELASQPRARLHMDDMLCAIVLGAVMLSGAGRVALGPVNIGFVLAGLAILLAASIGGCAAAVTTGLICGVSLSLCGHANSYVVCYAFTGILCGLFYGRKPLVLSLIYLLCSLFSSYALRFGFDLPFLLATLLSCLLFLALPRRGVTAAFTWARRFSPDAAGNEAAYAQHMRAQWCGSISRLAQLLPEVRVQPPDSEEQLEDIVTRLCAGCERMPQCWQEEKDARKAALRSYFLTGESAAPLEDCLRRENWPSLALEIERANQQYALRCAYAHREREATRTHLTAIAQAMQRLSREGGQCDRDDELLRGEAEYLLRHMRIPGKVIYALRVSQHVLLALRYEPQLTRQRQLERYQEELSQALGLPLHVAQRSKDIILFEETPPLQAECYHLSASAGDVRGANGDAVLMRTALGGLELCMLSDGMGHGEAAHAESEKTLELLSLCIDAGYPLPAALDAINCIMLSSTDGEQYATVDLCAADLWAGTAQLYKLGACPSLLITGASLRTLESSALPLGILPDVRSAAHTFTIGDGDMLLQFTDGLSDACGGLHALEKQVELLMRDRLHASPEAVCTALLSAAMRRAGGVPQDDMTILCTLFKKRQSKKRELPSRDAS